MTSGTKPSLQTPNPVVQSHVALKTTIVIAEIHLPRSTVRGIPAPGLLSVRIRDTGRIYHSGVCLKGCHLDKTSCQSIRSRAGGS